MSQVTIYLPEAVLTGLRKKAREAHKSVSAYLADLVRRDVQPEQWPRDFVQLYAASAGTLSEADDSLPETRASL